MDTDTRGFPPGELRVSDADRDRALSELSKAFQVGRITADELGQRSGQVLGARTGKDLTALLADLPVDRAPADTTALQRAVRPPSRIAIGASVAATCLAAVAVTNALSQGPSPQQRELTRELLARQGLSVPLPPSPGFDWAGTITPGAIAVLLVVLIIFLRATRDERAGGDSGSRRHSRARPPTAYEVSTDQARVDHDAVYRYLSEHAPWAAGIPRHLFDRAVDHSRCYGLYHAPTGEQAGFCRVITDYATFAYLDDLSLLPGYRRMGLGRHLVQAVLDDRELADVKSWRLLADSREARALFRRAGFADPEPERVARWMAVPNRSRGYWAALRTEPVVGRSRTRHESSRPRPGPGPASEALPDDS
jgi:GNAT superfamily N-acetyltransferase